MLGMTGGGTILGICAEGRHLRLGGTKGIGMNRPIGGGRIRGTELMIEGGKGRHAWIRLPRSSKLAVTGHDL